MNKKKEIISAQDRKSQRFCEEVFKNNQNVAKYSRFDPENKSSLPQVFDEMEKLDANITELGETIKILRDAIGPVMRVAEDIPTSGAQSVEKSLVPLAAEIRGKAMKLQAANNLLLEIIGLIEL